MTLLMSSWTRTAWAMAWGERGSSLCWLVEEPSPLWGWMGGQVCVCDSVIGETRPPPSVQEIRIHTHTGQVTDTEVYQSAIQEELLVTVHTVKLQWFAMMVTITTPHTDLSLPMHCKCIHLRCIVLHNTKASYIDEALDPSQQHKGIWNSTTLHKYV